MASLSLAKLLNRKLLKISGPDCYPYLQGLLCNDLRYLYEPDRIPKRKHARVSSSVLSTYLLNSQGRTICDMLLYRTPNTRYQCEFSPPGKATEPDELLIECDSSLANGLADTLYGYRVRRKISLQILDNHFVWCLYPNLNHSHPNSFVRAHSNQLEPKTEGGAPSTKTSIVPSLAVDDIIQDDLTAVSDPRLELLGLRILAPIRDFSTLKSVIQSKVSHSKEVDTIEEASLRDYTVHRYRLGVGEGPKDHIEGTSFPLECNADVLGSVSFSKGCYLGQELTARIHFTGVVRKRLMPITVNKQENQNVELAAFSPMVLGSELVNESTGKKVGTFRHIVHDHGLALLRQDLVDESTQLVHPGSKTKLSTYKPFWFSQIYQTPA